MDDIAVAGLCLYPVKSCRGVDLDRAAVAATGLAAHGVRDREWMLVDRAGRFVTQRECPRMALLEPLAEEASIALRAPGLGPVRLDADGAARDVTVWGARVRGFDAGNAAADALSAFLDRDVRIVRFDDAKPRSCNPDYVGDSGATTLFADGYPLLVVGRPSLDDLNARLHRRGFPPVPMNRFRPNVVIDGLEPYDEDHVDTISIGDAVLRLVKPCTRCEITTTDQDSGRRLSEPLRTLATYRRDDRLAGVTFGMNAIVVAGAGSVIERGAAGRATFRFG